MDKSLTKVGINLWTRLKTIVCICTAIYATSLYPQFYFVSILCKLTANACQH